MQIFQLLQYLTGITLYCVMHCIGLMTHWYFYFGFCSCLDYAPFD